MPLPTIPDDSCSGRHSSVPEEQVRGENGTGPPTTTSISCSSSYTSQEESDTTKRPRRAVNKNHNNDDNDRPTTTTAYTCYSSCHTYYESFCAITRSMLEVDHTVLNVVPGIRTAGLLMIEWMILGVGNETSTPFQLAALFVGLVDPNASLSKRLRYMGLTGLSVLVMGTALPGLVWDSKGAKLTAAFAVALLTGYAPLLGSPPLFIAMKLATALFAVNGGVLRSSQGFEEAGGLQAFVLYAFLGALASLSAALLPEIVGTREALRSNLFQLWHGFGCRLNRWRSKLGTTEKLKTVPVPTITLAIYKMEDIARNDIVNEDTKTREWVTEFITRADSLKAAMLCLANIANISAISGTSKEKRNDVRNKKQIECIDNIFVTVGHALRFVALAIQFPWILGYNPLFWFLYRRAMQAVQDATVAFNNDCRMGSNDDNEGVLVNSDFDSDENVGSSWLLPIVDVIRAHVEAISAIVTDTKAWPPRELSTTLPRRCTSAFGYPSTDTIRNKACDWAVHSFAWRFAFACSLSTLPELYVGEGYRAYWFPMTVALIMAPAEAANYEKVIHRIVGTLFGLLIGTALFPLFQFIIPHILLLGLCTFGVVCFFPANYAAFTCCITCWVVTTVVGAGAPWDETVVYRVMWTFAAGLLVLIVTSIAPATSDDDLGDKLAAMAKATKEFAKVAVDENTRVCHTKNDSELGKQPCGNSSLKHQSEIVDDARQQVIKTRLALLQSLNSAAMTPTRGNLLDPHSVAPAVTSDLVEAVVLPITLLLVPCDDAIGLVSDIDDVTYGEIDRLVYRLEKHGNLKDNPVKSTVDHMVVRGRGPFSNAIAQAHERLDEAGLPSGELLTMQHESEAH